MVRLSKRSGCDDIEQVVDVPSGLFCRCAKFGGMSVLVAKPEMLDESVVLFAANDRATILMVA